MFFTRGGRDVSPWHDLPFQPAAVVAATAPQLFTYVNEIPKATLEKLEVNTKVPHNPIVQDTVKKTGALRCFTYGRLPFNYGCVPQTWEDPSHKDSRTGCFGDGDPVDVVELSDAPLAIGAVVSVRILGVLGLIDEGETDWKIIAVQNSSSKKTLGDVPLEVRSRIQDWFRNYKTTDGKPQNEFWSGGVIHGEQVALEVLHDCQGQYALLMEGRVQPEASKKLWLR
jgi:inorganic pyrophosphatase